MTGGFAVSGRAGSAGRHLNPKSLNGIVYHGPTRAVVRNRQKNSQLVLRRPPSRRRFGSDRTFRGRSRRARLFLLLKVGC